MCHEQWALTVIKLLRFFFVLIQLKTDAIDTASRLAVYIIVKQSKTGQPCARLAMSIDTYKLFFYDYDYFDNQIILRPDSQKSE